jgi:energy-coupling factor transport system ATP-binding protein
MLDPVGRLDVARLVRDLLSQGRTIIYVTHNVDEIVEADRIIVMGNGQIIFDDSPSALFSDPGKCSSIGIEIPAIPRMSNELVKSGYPDFRGVMTLDELVEVSCRYRFRE